MILENSVSNIQLTIAGINLTPSQIIHAKYPTWLTNLKEVTRVSGELMWSGRSLSNIFFAGALMWCTYVGFLKTLEALNKNAKKVMWNGL